MPKAKKGWKESQRDRQAKQQSAEEARRIKRDQDSNKKSRRFPKTKVIVLVSAILLVLSIYGAIQFAVLPSAPVSYTTVYIRADGSVDPSNVSISIVASNRYGFAGDLHGFIVVERDNVVIDGGGYVLRGNGESGSKGVDLTGRSNVTVSALVLRGFGIALYFDSSSRNKVLANDIADSSFGIEVRASSDNTISSNRIANCGGAIGLSNSTGNVLRQNNLIRNQYSISFANSTFNTVSENIIASSAGAIGLFESSENSIKQNNLDSNYYGIDVANSSSNSISLNSVKNSTYAIGFTESSNNNVTENILARNENGLILQGSSGNSFFGNTVTDSSYGIGLSESSDNVIVGNYFGNNEYGVYVTYSSGNLIFRNMFPFNTYQVFSLESTNVWDGDLGTGGNYWGDYRNRYPDAEQLNSLGFWNMPYVIDANNQDNYPLING